MGSQMPEIERSNSQPEREPQTDESGSGKDLDRRELLRGAAKAGVVVPPAMALLLSTTMSSPAIAASGGRLGTQSTNSSGDWRWWR